MTKHLKLLIFVTHLSGTCHFQKLAKVSNTVETAMHWLIEGLNELKEKCPRRLYIAPR